MVELPLPENLLGAVLIVTGQHGHILRDAPYLAMVTLCAEYERKDWMVAQVKAVL